MEDKSLHLDQQICFPLYAASRELTKMYQPYLEKLNLTYPQYLVMLCLWEQGEMSVGQVGKRLVLNTNTLTPILKKLELKGFIDRNRKKDDERMVLISLTEKGLEIKQNCQFIPESLMSQVNLNQEELIELKRILDKFLNLE